MRPVAPRSCRSPWSNPELADRRDIVAVNLNEVQSIQPSGWSEPGRRGATLGYRFNKTIPNPEGVVSIHDKMEMQPFQGWDS